MEKDCSHFRTPSINFRQYEDQIVKVLAEYMEKGHSPQDSLNALLGLEGLTEQQKELTGRLYEEKKHTLDKSYRQQRTSLFTERNAVLKELDKDIEIVKEQIKQQEQAHAEEISPVAQQSSSVQEDYFKETEDFKKRLDERLSEPVDKFPKQQSYSRESESKLSNALGYMASALIAPLLGLAALGGMAASYMSKKLHSNPKSKRKDSPLERPNRQSLEERQHEEKQDYQNPQQEQYPKSDATSQDASESNAEQKDKEKSEPQKNEQPNLENLLSKQEDSDLIRQLSGKSIEEMKGILEKRRRKIGVLKVVYKGVEIGAKKMYSSIRRRNI